MDPRRITEPVDRIRIRVAARAVAQGEELVEERPQECPPDDQPQRSKRIPHRRTRTSAGQPCQRCGTDRAAVAAAGVVAMPDSLLALCDTWPVM